MVVSNNLILLVSVATMLMAAAKCCIRILAGIRYADTTLDRYMHPEVIKNLVMREACEKFSIEGSILLFFFSLMIFIAAMAS